MHAGYVRQLSIATIYCIPLGRYTPQYKYLLYLNFSNSLNTFLCKNLSSSQLVDAGPSTTVQQLKQLPDKELRVLYRISQLTGVLLERATTSLGIDTQDLAVIPAADQAEVQWARRTLHEYVNLKASSFLIHSAERSIIYPNG